MKYSLQNPTDVNKAELLEKINKIAKQSDLKEWGDRVKKWDKVIKDYESKKGLR